MPPTPPKPIVASVVQFTPVYLKPRETADRMLQFLATAHQERPSLVVFPELALSGYPNWIDLNNPATAPSHTEYFREYFESALTLESPEIKLLRTAAMDFNCVVVAGFAERPPNDKGSLFDSALAISPSGAISVHRKLCLVKHEQLFFDRGNGSDVAPVASTPAIIGVGICAENWLVPYQYALSQFQEQVHCALWVNLPRLRHIVEASSVSWAFSLGVFNLVACQFDRALGPSANCDLQFIGGSCILGPTGLPLAGPDFESETILTAELDLAAITRASATFCLAGRDGRPDLFGHGVATFTSPAQTQPACVNLDPPPTSPAELPTPA